jgi:mannose-6-phosphate isomerase-like protein (cupin superfamily)
VTAGVAEVAPGDELKPHHHAPPELYFFLSGEGWVHIAGVDYPVQAESAAFIPGHAVHGIRNTGAVPLRLFYLFPVNTFADVEYHFVEG